MASSDGHPGNIAMRPLLPHSVRAAPRRAIMDSPPRTDTEAKNEEPVWAKFEELRSGKAVDAPPEGHSSRAPVRW